MNKKKNQTSKENIDNDDHKENNIFNEIEGKYDKLLDEEEFIQRCTVF